MVVEVNEDLLNNLMTKFEALQSEVEQLRVESAQQKAQISNLQGKLTSTQAKTPQVSRRKLLKNMAMVAAGTVAAGAALASGNGQVRADGVGTVGGATTANFGFTAIPGVGVAPYQPVSGTFGVIGVTDIPGVTISDKVGVLGYSTAELGMLGYSRNKFGIYGITESSSSSFAGVYGYSANTNGVLGLSSGVNAAGVTGTHNAGTGSAYGVYGSSNSSSGIGVFGTGGIGVYGISSEAAKGGVQGINNTAGAYGVSGSSVNGIGVYGTSTNSNGVYGSSGALGQAGVFGINSSATGIGVRGESSQHYGVYGISTAAGKSGILGENNNSTGYGVSGTSTNGVGVYGTSNAAGRGGVRGVNNLLNGWGVNGESANGTAVYGLSSNGIGVTGITNNLAYPGVFGYNTQGDAIAGYAGQSSTGDGPSKSGVYGVHYSTGVVTHGVFGRSFSALGYGMFGYNEAGGIGIGADSNGGLGAEFKGTLAPLRLIPKGTAGAPTTGTHKLGELVTSTEAGSTSNLYYCKTAGTPGTWVKLNHTINGNENDVTIAAGTNVTVDNSVPGTITISATAGGGGVSSLNGQTGGVNLTAANGSGITIGTPGGGNVPLSANLTAGTGISLTPSGATTAITVANTGVTGVSVNGGTNVTGNINMVAGSNVTLSQVGQDVIVAATGGGGVPSVNGVIGAVTIQQNGAPVTPSGNNINIVVPSTAFLTKPIRVAASTNSGGDKPLLTSDGTGNPNSSFQIVQITGVAVDGLSVPAGAKAIICSVTSVGATAAGNLRLWPTGAATPTVNNLNIPANPATGKGFNLTTAAIVGLSSDGKVSIGYSNGVTGATCGFSIDISGYII